jgi:hypothetical protein
MRSVHLLLLCSPPCLDLLQCKPPSQPTPTWSAEHPQPRACQVCSLQFGTVSGATPAAAQQQWQQQQPAGLHQAIMGVQHIPCYVWLQQQAQRKHSNAVCVRPMQQTLCQRVGARHISVSQESQQQHCKGQSHCPSSTSAGHARQSVPLAGLWDHACQPSYAANAGSSHIFNAILMTLIPCGGIAVRTTGITVCHPPSGCALSLTPSWSQPLHYVPCCGVTCCPCAPCRDA